MIFRKFIKSLLLITPIFFFTLAHSNNAIYYVDMDHLMNKSLAGKSIILQLEKINKSNLINFKKIEKGLKEDERTMISQKNIVSEDEYKKRFNSLRKKIEDYNSNRNKLIEDTVKSKANAQKTLINTLTPILADYAKKNSVAFIMPKENIIIGKSELDITKNILEILDSKIKNIELK